MSRVALASVIAFSTGCQKEDLSGEQFAPSFAADSNNTGQLIEGQYIVVFRNGSSGAFATSAGQGLTASRTSAALMRAQVFEAAGVESEDVNQVYEGAVNGFAAHLSAGQLAALRSNSAVAYVEQDRYLSLGKVNKTHTTKGDSGTKGNGLEKGSGPRKDKYTFTPSKPMPTEPAPTEPTPTEPLPTEPTPAPGEPAPTEPAPTEPTPTEPTPTAPAPTAPSAPAPAPSAPATSYTKITPMPGETLPWNIERVGYGDGTGKTVWIIDSGIDTDHPDLNVDLTRCASFIYGMPSYEDGYGHGTNVAGIIAAKNNGTGMLGVATNATIVALRVFDDLGAGTVSRAISAVNHISNYGKPGDVVNMSLGGGISGTLDEAVRLAATKGILFAIAAGNSAVDCKDNSPARVDAPGVYTISAMDTYNVLWDRSNFGASVDFTAPGVNVTVTTKNGSIGGGAFGTSMAAPHVAGILLLRGQVFSQGFVSGDKDGMPDPVASVE